MNIKIVKVIFVFAVTLTCAGLSAQEEVMPTKKQTPSKADREARAKVREQRLKAKAKADAELRAKAVDINHASKTELMKLPGIPAEFAAAIIAKRPYQSKAELVTKNVIPQGTYLGIRSLVVVK